jgi:excisionase family DNA binding protein
MNMETKEYLTLKDVAELLTIDEETVRRWSVSGKIPAVKIGHFWRYRKADIDTLFNQGGK